MSMLYLGKDSDSLADRLASLVDESTRQGDCFASVPIAVPNRYLGKWLRLGLARRLGVAINLRFQYLETLMWDLLRAVDGRAQPLPVAVLEHDAFRIMILSLLLNETEGQPALAPFQDYLRQSANGYRPAAIDGQLADSRGPRADSRGGAPRRDYCRRAWQLADRLAGLIRDYEYHRQDGLIRKWLRDPAGQPSTGPDAFDLEHGQRELYRRIVCPPDGLQILMGKARNQLLLTLPQYAQEVMNLPRQQLAEPAGPPMVHLFGITQISALHVRILHWLGQRYDLRLYHLNPLAGRLIADCGLQIADCGLQPHNLQSAIRNLPLDELLASWGQAGAESLWLMADLLAGGGWRVAGEGWWVAGGGWRVAGGVGQPAAESREPRAESREPRADRREPTAESREPTVLQRLQNRLLGEETEAQQERLPQDTSVQIVACPGIYREVETVYHSIVDNLLQDPNLKQTDIAVLVTDMPRYRPVLQAVFDRQPRRVLYNLADFSAAGLSAFGAGVVGLLDLALESFSRSRVFAVLLNPCFLARLGVDRVQALTWLEWVEALGIYHSWDHADKQQRGYPPPCPPATSGGELGGGPLYSWRLGLQRLRLGRLMEVSDEEAEAPALRYQTVIPFADLTSGDQEQLEAFCRAVEGLLPFLAKLRNLRLSGAKWAVQLQQLLQDFLVVPPDRPDEEEVRDQFLGALDELRLVDQLSTRSEKGAELPLGLVREFVQDSLETLVGTKGEYLTGGVTISALQPLRPVPFQVIYLVGLGEGLFPGSSALPALDLRSRQRGPGDIHLAESNRFLFLEALLAARQKIYLLYNNRDLQKDQVLHPCSPVNQLRHYLEQHLLDGKFAVTQVPLCGNDRRYLQKDAQGPASDVLANYAEAERLRALADGQRTGEIRLEGSRAADVERRLQQARRSFAMANGSALASPAMPTITVRDLGRFLRCPAEAAVRRHLRLDDEEETEPRDDEPFYTSWLVEHRLVARGLRRFVRQAVQESVEAALANWRSGFAALYEEWRLRGRVPDGAFAQVDQARLEQLLHQRIAGAAGLASFLRRRQGFCGPVLLGENTTPIGARQHFPALTLTLSGEGGNPRSCPAEVRLVGHQTFVWRADQALEILVLTSSNRRKVQDDLLSVPMFEPLLFFLALKAGTAADPEGMPAQDWVGERECRLHLANEEKIRSFVYLPGEIPADVARSYLTTLTRDYLDRSSFDLLPFELVVTGERPKIDKNKLAPPLMEAISCQDHLLSADDLVQARKDYVQRFQEAIEEDEERDYPYYRPMKLMEIVDAQVPGDAWEKMKRRFQLLDLGPARNRQ